MNESKDFMELAIDLAEVNIIKQDGGPFGAVVVKDDVIVGKGSNHVTLNNDPTAHAEIEAIRDACKTLNTFNLEGCEIYASCEPCPMCLGAIYWSRIGKLYYGATKDDASKADFDDSFIYKEFELSKEQRSIPSVQLMRDKAIKVFQDWIDSENKIPY
ncbi:MAG: tRNA-specific adenosine deaminase [Marinilabiliales bacterium]|nr:MAG: tRNA-specific adenosine deaminase [Marinilabiliales bacterium]